jgi:hypothetical protein
VQYPIFQGRYSSHTPTAISQSYFQYATRSRRSSLAEVSKFGSYGSATSYGDDWNEIKLLGFTENVRAKLEAPVKDDMDDICELLSALLRDELAGDEHMQFRVVVGSRCDKVSLRVAHNCQITPHAPRQSYVSYSC